MPSKKKIAPPGIGCFIQTGVFGIFLYTDLHARRASNKRCVHGRQPNKCHACGGSSICPHGSQRNHCRPCETDNHVSYSNVHPWGSDAEGPVSVPTANCGIAARPVADEGFASTEEFGLYVVNAAVPVCASTVKYDRSAGGAVARTEEGDIACFSFLRTVDMSPFRLVCVFFKTLNVDPEFIFTGEPFWMFDGSVRSLYSSDPVYLPASPTAQQVSRLQRCRDMYTRTAAQSMPCLWRCQYMSTQSGAWTLPPVSLQPPRCGARHVC